MIEEKTITIFYSWQSDIEGSKKGIRQALRKASTEVENDFGNLKIKLDEATDNRSGSPDIAKVIFDKIPKCDIFLCDLSTVNNYAPEGERKLQNPNVLIELGFAIAHLGWSRIILLFNKNCGEAKDLPFDVRGHRAQIFLINDNDDKSGIGNLAKNLEKPLKLIIEHNPEKPNEKSITPEERKRQLDIKKLEWILSSIHIPTFDMFISFLPKTIINGILDFWEDFKAIFESSQFHLYDEKAKDILGKFKESWEFSMNSYNFHHGKDGNYHYNNIPQDFSNNALEQFVQKQKNVPKLLGLFRELLDFLRENYIEIDLDKTSNKALTNAKQYKN